MAEGSEFESSVEVVWEEEQRFRGGRPGSPTLVVDGARTAAPSPVEAMIVALGSCSAIDVLEILSKRRTPASGLTVRVDFSRAPTPPRRVTAARLHFTVDAESEPHHVARAVELSMSKYCSVAASLTSDAGLTWTVDVRPTRESLAEPANSAQHSSS